MMMVSNVSRVQNKLWVDLPVPASGGLKKCDNRTTGEGKSVVRMTFFTQIIENAGDEGVKRLLR